MAKIRQGFVSNSSSSSFLIYGTVLNKDQLLAAIPKDKLSDVSEDTEVYELQEIIFDGTDLDNHSNFDMGDYVWVGSSWSSIKDDQTGKQFKEEVKEELAKLGFNDVELKTHSEACYNG